MDSEQPASPAAVDNGPAQVTTPPATAETTPPAEAAASSSPPPEATAPDPAPAPAAEPPRDLTLLEKHDADAAAAEAAAKEAAEKEAAPAKEPEPAKDEPKPAEPKPEAAPEPFVFKDFELPEGLVKDDKVLEEFKGILTADKVDPQKRGQDLIALHHRLMQDYANKVENNKTEAWNEYNRQQTLLTMSDPELGGSAFNTTIASIARTRDILTQDWSPEERADLNTFLANTGAGSHRAFLRFIHSAGKYVNEPQAPAFVPQPPLDNGVRETRGGRRGAILYDNPRSK